MNKIRLLVLLLCAVLQTLLSSGPRTDLPFAGTMSLSPVEKALVSRTLGEQDTRYQIAPTVDGYAGENPAQHLAVRFDVAGARLRASGVVLPLTVRGWGNGDNVQALAPTTPQAIGNRIAWQSDGLTAWYVNGPSGWEQGFTINAPLTQEKPDATSAGLGLQLNLGDWKMSPYRKHFVLFFSRRIPDVSRMTAYHPTNVLHHPTCPALPTVALFFLTQL